MQHTPHSPRIPAGLLIAGAAVALVPIIGCGVFAWTQWRALIADYPWFTDTLKIFFPLLLAVFAAVYCSLFALGAFNRWASRRAADADKQADLVRAGVQVAPLATSFAYHYVPQVTQADQLALAAPIDVLKPLDAWMTWIDEQPHCLLAGRTKSGKTHTASALLARRLQSDETAFLIDPHSSGWMGLPTVGFVGLRADGKPDTTALHAALMDVAREYIRRMQARDEHKTQTGNELPHNHWPRWTILIDESNYIADTLPTVWREFIKALASGGRKVGISLICLAQSPLVEDLGLSGSMRANFARLGLDDRSVQQLIGSDEKDAERKKALHAALIGQERPAAATIDAQVWLLDRRGLEAGTREAGKPSSVLTQRDGNERSNAVTSPGADSSTSSIVPTAAEIATIAVLSGNTASEAAKKLDGYHPRKYAEYRAKVDYVQALLDGGTQ